MSILINIEQLLSNTSIEGERIEFKQEFVPRTVMRSICAFANDFENVGSGYIVIGVEEENGIAKRPVLGFAKEDFDALQKKLLEYCNRIKPTYFPKVSLEEVDSKFVVVIWVPAGSNRPYQVPDDITSANSAYNYRIRKYSSSKVPTEEEKLELIQLTAKIPFDDRVNHNASINDLDFGLLREHLASTKSKLYEESAQLELVDLAKKMDLCQGADEHLFPKNIGLLMFSKTPELYFKGAQIDLVIFKDGTDAKAFEEKIFKGPIQKQLIDVLSFLKTNILKSVIVKRENDEKSDTIFNYPFAALEEAISNAVYHKNYELNEPIEIRVYNDKIEIISYNGVDSSLKQKDFDEAKIKARRYRNRKIGEFLKDLGLTEGRATGVPTIHNTLKNNQSPKPSFDLDLPDRRHFVVEIPIHTYFESNLGNQDSNQDSNQVNSMFKLNIEQLKKALEATGTSYPPNTENKEKYKAYAGGLSHEEILILKYCYIPKKKKDILEDCLGLTNQTKNFKKHTTFLIRESLIRMTLPNTPSSRHQKYFTTEGGKIVLHTLEENK